MLITLDVSHLLNTLIGVYILDEHLNGDPLRWPTTVTSKLNAHSQLQIAHIKFKSLTANSNRSQRITNHSQQITNCPQQIQIVHSKLKSHTANSNCSQQLNYKLLTAVDVFGYLQRAVQLV